MNKSLNTENLLTQFHEEKMITNYLMGQQIKFLSPDNESADGMLEMESIYAPLSKEPPMHYHPFQDEYFEVLSGALTIKFDDGVKTYLKGDAVRIKANENHAMWNADKRPAIVNWKVSPALETEHFITSMFMLANDQKTGRNGVPKPVIMIYMLGKYAPLFRLKKPGYRTIKLLSFLLQPLFLLRGYPKRYK